MTDTHTHTLTITHIHSYTHTYVQTHTVHTHSHTSYIYSHTNTCVQTHIHRRSHNQATKLNCKTPGLFYPIVSIGKSGFKWLNILNEMGLIYHTFMMTSKLGYDDFICNINVIMLIHDYTVTK